MDGLSNTIHILQGDSLKAKSARGVMKLSMGAGVERVLRLVRTMILTRILAPDQFGLMAIILVLVNGFESLSEVGIKLAVVQNKRGCDPEFLNATWWFQAVRGLGLFAVAMLAAPFVSSFYEKPHLLILLQVALLSIVFRGFISPRAYTFQREYKFGLIVLHIQGSAFCGTIVTIVCAFVLKNIWALVIGYVAESFCLCFLSYILAPFKLRLGIDRKCLKELTTFARGMFGTPILTIIGPGATVFVLGKVVTEEQLGLYSLAGQLASLPILFFSQTIGQVLLPGFARKQDDRVSLNKAVLKVSKIVTSFTIPLVVYMMVCSSGLLFILWGPRYVEVTIPASILSLAMLARIQGNILSTTYIALGRPELQRRYAALRAANTVVLIYPMTVYFGLTGAAVVSVFTNHISLLMLIFWCRKVMPLKYDEYFRCYMPGLLLAFPVIIIIHLMLFLSYNSMILILITGALVLFITYTIYFGKMFLANNSKISSQIKRQLSITEKTDYINEETTSI